MTYNDGNSLQTLPKKSQNKTGVSLYYFPARRFHPSVQVATNDKRTCFFLDSSFSFCFLVTFRLFMLWLNRLTRILPWLEASLCVIISDPLKAIKLY